MKARELRQTDILGGKGDNCPGNVRIHNSTGKCDECDLQKGIVRKFRAHSFSAAVGTEVARVGRKLCPCCTFAVYFTIGMVIFFIFWIILILRIFIPTATSTLRESNKSTTFSTTEFPFSTSTS